MSQEYNPRDPNSTVVATDNAGVNTSADTNNNNNNHNNDGMRDGDGDATPARSTKVKKVKKVKRDKSSRSRKSSERRQRSAEASNNSNDKNDGGNSDADPEEQTPGTRARKVKRVKKAKRHHSEDDVVEKPTRDKEGEEESAGNAAPAPDTSVHPTRLYPREEPELPDVAAKPNVPPAATVAPPPYGAEGTPKQAVPSPPSSASPSSPPPPPPPPPQQQPSRSRALASLRRGGTGLETGAPPSAAAPKADSVFADPSAPPAAGGGAGLNDTTAGRDSAEGDGGGERRGGRHRPRRTRDPRQREYPGEEAATDSGSSDDDDSGDAMRGGGGNGNGSASKRILGGDKGAAAAATAAAGHQWVAPQREEREAAAVAATPAAAAGGARLPANSLLRLHRLQRTFEALAPRLYSFCATHVTEWPSLALAWLPDRQFEDPERDYTLQYLAVGTQTRPPYLSSGGSGGGSANRNAVHVMEVAVPLVQRNRGVMYHLFGDDDADGGDAAMREHDRDLLRENTDPGKLFANVKGHCAIEQSIWVDSPVLKIAPMPLERSILAIKTATGFTGIYNTVQEPRVDARGLTAPDAVLRGHKMGGFGLSWSVAKPGYLATGGDDGFVNYYDVRHRLTIDLAGAGGSDAADAINNNGAAAAAAAATSPDVEDAMTQPVQRLTGHSDGVNDVCWHNSQAHMLVSAGADGDVRLWDIRTGHTSARLEGAHGGPGGATAAQFHPVGDFQLATAGGDGDLRLWDVRHPQRSVVDLSYHGAAVNGIAWAPFSETVLATFADDGRVVYWDLAKTSLPESYAADGTAPPEVCFVHTGHMGRVGDFAWAPGKTPAHRANDWLAASTDECNGLHLYVPRQSAVEDFTMAPEALETARQQPPAFVEVG